MKKSCIRLAMATLGVASLLATTISGAFSGAIYTSLGSGTTVNANNYDECAAVYLNGGPQNQNSAGLPDGEYYFQVTNPNGGDLLSTTPAFQRRVKVVDGVIFGRAADLDPAGYVDGDSNLHHVEGTADVEEPIEPSVPNAENGSIPVQLWNFTDTTNAGGVYKAWLIAYKDAEGNVISSVEVAVDGIALIFDSNDAKTDNFRCVHDDPGGGGHDVVLITGRKYYDANGNGVDDGETEDWTDADGRPRVMIQLCYTAPEASEVCVDLETDSTGNWGFLVPEGSTFSACETVPDGYEQTGPLDEAEVNNADASAGAEGGCWDGLVTTVGLGGISFGNVDLTIGGVKFYDADVNGVFDDGEATIEGFKIILWIDGEGPFETLTDVDGAWSYQVPFGSSVTVCEELPLGTWIQTYPGGLGCHDVESASPETESLDFGNVCLGAGGGRTLGFWSNKNGQATMNDGPDGVSPELAMLADLNLRNANGTDFDCTSYSKFRTWLLNATATNMAYMLSAQLAAMKLNVEAGFVSGDSIVYAPGCASPTVAEVDGGFIEPALEFISIADLMTAANNSLGAFGGTTSPHDERCYQERLKNALDAANNNLSFVQAVPCLPIVYPAEQ